MAQRNLKETWLPVLAAAVTLLAMALGSLQTGHRGWGFGVWSFLGASTPWVLFGVGVILTVIVALVVSRTSNVAPRTADTSGSHQSRYFYPLLLLGIAVVFFVAFRVFSVQSFFLGDGYTLLSNIGAASPILKGRQIVAQWLPYWISGQLDGPPGDRALLAYQIVSWSSGLLFVLIAGSFAASLYRKTRTRVLFVLGLASSGYVLMFFGYVENYALFLVTVLAFCGYGALVADGRLPWWPTAIIIGLASALHIFGVLLVPAALYLLATRFHVWSRLSKKSRFLALAAGALVVLVGLGGVIYLYETNLFFRFSFVPLTQQFYTVSDYTLFSWHHLADMGSLLILLAPGLIVLVAGVAVIGTPFWKSVEFRFLGLLGLTCLAAAFLFDPKLGMPRDWDLFAFVGVPLLFLSLRVVLADEPRRVGTMTAAVAILVGLFALGGRLAVQTNPHSGLALADSYYRLDPLRNKNLLLIMHRFHMERGEIKLAEAVSKRWTELPEEKLYTTAQEAWMEDRQAGAIALYEEAIRCNPTFPPSYAYLAQCYFMQNRLDTAIAILETARGLSPHNPRTYTYLGYWYYVQGQRRKAEEYLNTGIEYNPLSAGPYFYLSLIALDDGRSEEHERLLRKAVLMTDASGEMFLLLAGIEATRKNYEKAASAARMALDKFVDTSEVRNLVKQHPPLREWLPAYAQ